MMYLEDPISHVMNFGVSWRRRLGNHPRGTGTKRVLASRMVMVFEINLYDLPGLS